MYFILIFIFLFITVILYSLVHATTPYDETIDDKQQIDFLKHRH